MLIIIEIIIKNINKKDKYLKNYLIVFLYLNNSSKKYLNNKNNNSY